jgi:dephospho-CoA kinase
MMLFLSGLTGVGKSTTLKMLTGLPAYTLLPNRRELTDQIIIPEVLQDELKPIAPVKDRLERFRITAEYRKKYPSGIIQALKTHLATLPSGNYIFDNIRGLDECHAAVTTFPESRVIFLDAPPLMRLQRLLGRNDSFDQINHNTEVSGLLEQLRNIKDIQKTFDPEQIANLKTLDLEDDKIISAVHIILAEQKHYNATQAADFLKSTLSHSRLLYLDTSNLSIGVVAERIQEWI